MLSTEDKTTNAVQKTSDIQIFEASKGTLAPHVVLFEAIYNDVRINIDTLRIFCSEENPLALSRYITRNTGPAKCTASPMPSHFLPAPSGT